MHVGLAPVPDDPTQQDGAVLATARRFRFGDFEFHTSPARLLERGEVIKVRPQALQVLELLLSRAGQTVSREELRRHLWGDEEYVDHERGINSALLALRKALADDPQDPRFVETVPRQGYRFIAPVELSETPLVSRAEPASEQPSEDGRRSRVRRAMLVVLPVALLGSWLAWGRLGAVWSTAAPRVMIHPMQAASEGTEVRPSPVSLTDALVRILVTEYSEHLDIAAPVESTEGDTPAPLTERRPDYQVTSSLTFDEDGNFALTLKLVRSADRTILWADTRHLRPEELAQWPALAAADLVRTLESLPAETS